MKNLQLTLENHLVTCFEEEINEIIESLVLEINNQCFEEKELQYKEEFCNEYNDLIAVLELLKENNMDFFLEKEKAFEIKIEETNIKNEILFILIKIQKLLFKSLRFGFDSSYPGTDTTNIIEIKNNLFLLNKLVNYSYNNPIDENKIKIKKEKVKKFIEFAKEKKTILSNKEHLNIGLFLRLFLIINIFFFIVFTCFLLDVYFLEETIHSIIIKNSISK